MKLKDIREYKSTKHDLTKVSSIKSFKMNDRTYLASAFHDKKIIIQDSIDSTKDAIVLETGYMNDDIAAFKMNDKYYLAVACTGKNLTYVQYGDVSRKQSIDIWDIEAKKLDHSLEGHEDNVTSLVTYGKDGKQYLASAGLDKVIKIWDLDDRSCVAKLEGHSQAVNILALYEKDNETFLASGAYDNKIKLWDLTSKTCIATLEGHGNTVKTLEPFYKNGKPFLASGSYKQLYFWDLSNNELDEAMDDSHSGFVVAIKVFKVNDKQYLATGCREDDKIKLWNVDGYEEVKTLPFKYTTAFGMFDDTFVSGSVGGSCSLTFWNDKEAPLVPVASPEAEQTEPQQ